MDVPPSGDSVVMRVLSKIVTSSLTWWSLVILALYLLERFDLGVHSLPWNWKKRRSSLKGWMNGSLNHKDSIDGPSTCSNGHIHRPNGISRRTVPIIFHEFIQSQVIPAFRMQCTRKDNGGDFAVLVFTHIDSLQDVTSILFRQITFNGKPLVDSRLTTYPEHYRYDNYIVARSSQTEHPEALIASEVPALLAAYRKAERCYIRNPVPKFGVLYARSMPCSVCTEKIIKSLAGVCRKRTVVAYSDEDTRDGIKNAQRLTNAGFIVVKINP